jgi:hypothetical protein
VDRFKLCKGLASSHLLGDVEVLIHAVRARQYASIYNAFRRGRWPPSIIALIQRYHCERRLLFHLLFEADQIVYIVESAFKIISRAYITISASQAMNYLDYRREEIDGKAAVNGDESPGDDFINRVTNYGWSWDPQTNAFHPKPVIESALPDSDIVRTEAESIARLASLVGFLES